MRARDEKRLVLCRQTAAIFWRAVREGRIDRPSPCELPYPFDSISSYRELARIDLSPIGLNLTSQGAFSLRSQQVVTVHDDKRCYPVIFHPPVGASIPPGSLAPLNILVCSKNHSRSPLTMQPYVLNSALPPLSFCKISESLYVTSPALTYVQSCLTQRMLPNIELGLEWCGSYALSAPCCLRAGRAKNILCADEIRDYIDSLRHLKGIAAAREAATWLVDGLASPREAEVYLLLVLPQDHGGFGLPQPLVNAVIPLRGTSAEGLTSDSFYVADLMYLIGKSGVIVEYDGKDDHERNPDDVLRDKERRSVLAAMGYTVIVITRHDLSTPQRLRQKIEQIARAIDVTIPCEQTNEVQEARANLVKWLLNPSHDHLPFGYGYC